MINDSTVLPIDEDDKILGTPSAQKIMRLFSIWETLTVKEIHVKANLSEGQVHKTLNNLQKISLITKREKGIYQLSSSSYTKAVQEAILNRLHHYINSIISEIHKKLDIGNRDEAHDKFRYLANNFEPILKKNFAYKMNSLTHRFLDE